MRITEYFKATKAEMSHVNWPTRQQTVRFTVLVVVISLIVAALLGLGDLLFTRLLTLLF